MPNKCNLKNEINLNIDPINVLDTNIRLWMAIEWQNNSLALIGSMRTFKTSWYKVRFG